MPSFRTPCIEYIRRRWFTRADELCLNSDAHPRPAEREVFFTNESSEVPADRGAHPNILSACVRGLMPIRQRRIKGVVVRLRGDHSLRQWNVMVCHGRGSPLVLAWEALACKQMLQSLEVDYMMMKCSPLFSLACLLIQRVLLCPGSWRLLKHSCAGNLQLGATLQTVHMKCSMGLHSIMWHLRDAASCTSTLVKCAYPDIICRMPIEGRWLHSPVSI